MFRASTKAKNSFLKEILQETGKSPLLKESFLKGGSWRKLRGEREDSQRIMRNLALQSHCHRRLKKKIKFTILGQLQPLLLSVDWFVIVAGMQKYLTWKEFLDPRPLNFSKFSPHTFHLEKKIEVFLISFPRTQGKKSQGVEKREWHWHSHMLC